MFRSAYAWFSEIPARVAILDWSQHAVIALNFDLQPLITYLSLLKQCNENAVNCLFSSQLVRRNLCIQRMGPLWQASF